MMNMAGPSMVMKTWNMNSVEEIPCSGACVESSWIDILSRTATENRRFILWFVWDRMIFFLPFWTERHLCRRSRNTITWGQIHFVNIFKLVRERSPRSVVIRTCHFLFKPRNGYDKAYSVFFSLCRSSLLASVENGIWCTERWYVLNLKKN